MSDATAEQEGWLGFFLKHLNTISTVILLILAVVLFVRWRVQSAERAKMDVAGELSTAQNQVYALSRGQFPKTQSAADQMKAIQGAQAMASAAITNVLNSGDADTRMRAEAFVLRGDMYWHLGNLPPLPGSDSEPSLRLSESSDVLLQKAADSYQQVIKDPAFAGEHEQINTAHMGLAAIAENKTDWAGAQKELEAVSNDPGALAVLAEQAKLQIAELPAMKQPLYVAPPSGVASTQPTTLPAANLPFGPVQLPGSTTLPAATQSLHLIDGLNSLQPARGVPATRPSSGPFGATPAAGKPNGH